MTDDHQDPPLAIRPVAPSDAEAIWAIARQPGVLPTTLALPSDRLADVTKRLEELSTNDHYFVATIGDRVVGLGGMVVATGRYRHSAHVLLYVDETYHRRGIGSALLRQLLEVADDWLRVHRLELTVVAANVRARALYERHGFVVEGTRRDSLISAGDYVDELLMARLGR